MSDELWREVIARVPSLVVFGVFVLMIMDRGRKWMDESQEQWRVFIDAHQKEGIRAIERICSSLETLTLQVARNTTALIVHDLTVRGENSEIHGDHETLLKRILDK